MGIMNNFTIPTLVIGGVVGFAVSEASHRLVELEKRGKSNGGTGSTAEVSARQYHQLDTNTFVISANRDSSRDFIGSFGANLAAFRREHAGKFVLIPSYAQYPISNDALAIRESQVTDSGGTNTITFSYPSAAK